MPKLLTAIAFLTVLSQLQCGPGNGRYGVRRQTMSRVGTLPRPLLRSMSRTNSPTKSADLLEPGVLPSRQLDVVNAMENPQVLGRMNDAFAADIDAFRKKAEEMQSEIKKRMLRNPSMSDRLASEPGTAQSPSRQDSFPFRGAFGGSFGSIFDQLPNTPEPSNPPPSNGASRFRVQEPPSTSTMVATPIPPLPTSCSAAKQKPSINQYRASTKPSISKSPSIKGAGNNTSKAKRRRSGINGNSLPRTNSGSLKKQRFGGKTTVSEQLPNNGGTIEILISGSQIDDERMSQMIKEARNAITVVFYAPIFDTTQRGSVVYEERPAMQLF